MVDIKYYVVWVGREPGIYTNWSQCQEQIEGFPKAQYKKFSSLSEANEAFAKGAPQDYYESKTIRAVTPQSEAYEKNALAVDAACSGNPGRMEFQGVWLHNGELAFHFGPFEDATNNIGEFLALCRGLYEVMTKHPDFILYSDSRNAISWVMGGQCKTKLKENDKNKEVFDMVRASEAWLKQYGIRVKIQKWNTKEWGEIPADFGRK